MNEDLAWLRVQDVLREVENRRLMAEAPSGNLAASTVKLVGRIIRALIASASRGTRRERVAPPAVESRHHA
jgi:hypothetical protein